MLFTDGACSGNPGPGGWAFILRHRATGKELESSGAELETTNNRMELTAVVRGLSALKRPCRVELFTDSVYVGKGISEWMPKWKQNGWTRKEHGQRKSIKNEDLWRQLDELLSRHRVTYTRVAGHSGHPENERCDQLAVSAYERYR
jgi:ribonuclease HI